MVTAHQRRSWRFLAQSPTEQVDIAVYLEGLAEGLAAWRRKHPYKHGVRYELGQVPGSPGVGLPLFQEHLN